MNLKVHEDEKKVSRLTDFDFWENALQKIIKVKFKIV